jgi:hypothetical protein
MGADFNKLLINQVRGPAGGVAVILVFLAALFYYWQFLEAQPRARRVPIPASEIESAKGFGVCWRVPESLRSLRWHRVGVRLLENGQSLPWRLDNPGRVEQEGRGRFYVDKEWLWFSTSDNTRPSINKKQYQLEVFLPSYREAFIAAGLLAVALLSGAFLPAWRLWFRGETVLRLGAVRVLVPRRQVVGAGCVIAAAMFLLLPFTTGKICRQINIPAELLLQKSSGQWACYLSRWIRQDPYRVALVSVTENQQPLRLVTTQVIQQESARGCFNCDGDYLQFRPTDVSNPSVNGRNYYLKAPVFSPRLVTAIALVLGGLGLLLLSRWPAQIGHYFSLPSVRTGSWYGLLLIIALAKLYVVSGDEIVAAEADSYSYALTANQLFSGHNSTRLPTHPAFLSIVAATVALLGVPWRFALEVFYLGACFFLAESIRALVKTRLIAGLTFGLTVWHPWTLGGFRNFMSDPLVPVLLMALLAVMVRVLTRPSDQWKWGSFFLIGILLFAWESSRHEGLLVYAGYGLFVGLVLWVAKSSGGTFPTGRWPAVACLVLPLIMVFTLSGLVKWTQYCRYGVYAKSLIHSPGLTALMKALYRIKPDQDIRYAPVTRQSLEAACKVSPSLKPYATNLLDPQSVNTRIGEFYTKKPGEFGPWLNWLLPSSIPATTSTANQIMLEAAKEINQALQSGKLPSRPAFFPIDPNWHQWLPGLLPSFMSRMKEGFSMAPVDESPVTFHKPLLQKVFNEAASRRAANLYPRLLIGQGQVSAPPGAIDSIAITDQDGRLLGASLLFSNWWDNALTFDIEVPLEVRPVSYQLACFQGGRLRQVIPLDPEAGFSTNIPGSDFKVTGQASLAWIEPGARLRVQKCQVFCARYYPWVLFLSLLLTAGRIALATTWERRQGLVVTAGGMLVMGWIITRAALYALLDVNFSWKSARYMECVGPLCMIALVFAAVAFGGWFRGSFWPLLVQGKKKDP